MATQENSNSAHLSTCELCSFLQMVAFNALVSHSFSFGEIHHPAPKYTHMESHS